MTLLKVYAKSIKKVKNSIYNIGTSNEIKIKNLIQLISKIVKKKLILKKVVYIEEVCQEDVQMFRS